MNTKMIALTTSALVAFASLATTASAAGMMGDVRLGLGYNWTDESYGGEGIFDGFTGSIDGNYTAFSGGGRVNLPYSDTVNLQLDVNAEATMEQSVASGGDLASPSAVTFGAHVNYRDSTSLLGVFAGSGRVNDITGVPVFMAGFEGQYYLPDWTLSGQVGYLDADYGFLIQNAGFVKAGATYYPTSQLKLTASLAYVDGESDIRVNPNLDVTDWAWTLGVHYWFGKSIPVSGFLEYKGRSEDISWSGLGNGDLSANTVNAGVVFHFGGNGFKDADRNGASVDLPDAELFQLVPTAGAISF
jgi:hypothetical protein